MIPIQTYKGRRVAVFGLGRTGITAARALKAGGADVSAWDDSQPAREKAIAAGLELDDLNRRDWGDIAALILSPGVPLTHPKPHRMVELAKAVGAPVIGDMELFAQALNALPSRRRPKIIGITGTNGKSTTTALIGHILRATGRNAIVAGNIGDAILAQDPPRAGSYYVLELSSYQIDLTQSLRCDVAIMLNISPDHLERHGGFENYFEAKVRLFEMQAPDGVAIVGIDDDETNACYSRLRRERGEEFVIPISAGRVFARGVFALGSKVYEALDSASVPLVDLKQARALPGQHNAQNAAAAMAAVRALGVGGRAAAEAMKTFGGLPHRQEVVALHHGVRFINDSKATNALAALQALGAYENIYWIAGGRGKDDDLSVMRPGYGRVAKAFLIGETEDEFAAELDGRLAYERCGDLASAVRAAFLQARVDGRPDPVVLLSPAAASFDQFANFEARGAVFAQQALQLEDDDENHADAESVA